MDGITSILYTGASERWDRNQVLIKLHFLLPHLPIFVALGTMKHWSPHIGKHCTKTLGTTC